MNIHAIGVDLAEIDRVEALIENYGEKFLSRVFTETEIDYCRQKANAQSFAARFAVKEAVFKAAGTGLSLGMHWRDVEIVNNAKGKPRVELHGKTAEMLAGKKIHVSISHSGNLAIAMIVVENLAPMES